MRIRDHRGRDLGPVDREHDVRQPGRVPVGGRLALSDETGVPDIFPVNYVTHEGAIYIRTAADIKLVRIASHPVAAFEVDGGDDEDRWSVVARGTVSPVRDETEIDHAAAGRLPSWSPRYKPHVIKISPDTVTGRHFHLAAHPSMQPRRPTPIASYRPDGLIRTHDAEQR